MKVKKYFGQHFLTNEVISKRIANSLKLEKNNCLIEIGPGKGALTKFLIKKSENIILIEIDPECVEILQRKFKQINIFCEDFLKTNLNKLTFQSYSIIGNFPYNISSQILFKILEKRNQVNELVGMFQKEVADRVCSKPKSKKYGILSVLMQAYFDCNLLFDVGPENFSPQPKVHSSVIRLSRNNMKKLNCNHEKFIEVVKMGFSQRRKKLKNALKKIINLDELNQNELMTKRAEELSVFEFIELTNLIFTKH